MTDLSKFRNHLGQPPNLGSASFHIAPKAAPKKTPPKVLGEQPKKHHLGWLVTGYPPDAIEAARRTHETIRQAKAREGKGLGAPFHPDTWMNSAKPKKARTEPYVAVAAPNECAALLEKAGWQRVNVIEALK